MIKKYKPEILFTLAAFAAGGIGAIATYAGMPYYETLNKPMLTPPSILFPIVWTLLYILMGAGAGRVWKSGSKNRVPAIWIYFAQLAANAVWSLLFFGLAMHLIAFMWLVFLWGLIFWMARIFSQNDALAGKLQIPYLIWTAFAGYLNLAIWLLNR